MKLNRELHHIQRHIIKVLGLSEWARYRDLKLPGVESSLYNYHLREMMKTGLVEKVAGHGYRLTPSGLRYVDHVSISTFEPRWQPKIINTFVIENEREEVLMYYKMRQPFIGQLNLPSGKMHYDDDSLFTAAKRELSMIFREPVNFEYCGTLNMKALVNEEIVSHTIYFVHTARVSSSAKIEESYEWVKLPLANEYSYAPHVISALELVKSGTRGFLECVTVSRSQ